MQVIADTGIEVLITLDARLGELKKVMQQASSLRALIGIDQQSDDNLAYCSWRDIEAFNNSLPAG